MSKKRHTALQTISKYETAESKEFPMWIEQGMDQGIPTIYDNIISWISNPRRRLRKGSRTMKNLKVVVSKFSNVIQQYTPDDLLIDGQFESFILALEDMIKSLPAGLKTKIGENGVRLSGGQRQRIAIARAFYRDAKLLVLDEATSALDNKTESELMEALELLNKKLTTIFVAHRLSTVKNCDCIYEFQNGEIKAFGNFDELYKKSETFNAMIKNEYF